jgi:hypothetical protein
MGKNADSDRGGKQATALCLIACHKPSDTKPSPSVGIQKNVHHYGSLEALTIWLLHRTLAAHKHKLGRSVQINSYNGLSCNRCTQSEPLFQFSTGLKKLPRWLQRRSENR